MTKADMRIAILAEDKAGFIKPMAEGLGNMLSHRGIKTTIFYQGLAQLDARVSRRLSTRFKNVVKKVVNVFAVSQHSVGPAVTNKSHCDFIAALQGFTAVVVVCPIPRAFAKDSLSAIEQVRRQVNVPVVLYQNYFLASRGPWYERIVQAGGEGLERFDWYLAATTISEYPLVQLDEGKCWPVSVVGHDLRADSLAHSWDEHQWKAKAKRPFKVLLDFARAGFETQRALQKQVLDNMGLPYTELSGRYSIEQIRALYREHHVFMLSFRESFGLPIVENQLCGNWIFTPQRDWCPSHYLSANHTLGSNFVVYADAQQLAGKLGECLALHQQGYDYQSNCASFSEQYPFVFAGNKPALDDFIGRLVSGQINSQSHLNYAYLNQYIANC